MDKEPTMELLKQVRDSTAIMVCRGDSASEDDEYILALRDVGFETVRHLPLLEFSYRDSTKFMKMLEDKDFNHHGIIFTSPRSVFALENFIMKTPPLMELLRDRLKFVFAVGPRSSLEVEKKLGLKVSITEPEKAGNSKILAESILEFLKNNRIEETKFLMPCSSSAHDDLPNILTSHGVTVTRIPIYDTFPASDSPERLSNSLHELSSFTTVLLVFFSPSNVKSVSSLLLNLKKDETPQKVHFVAIGPTTESCLRDLSLAVFCVSPKPNPQSLSQAILHKILDGNTVAD
jgi:uroporphyrinogen-III synthase